MKYNYQPIIKQVFPCGGDCSKQPLGWTITPANHNINGDRIFDLQELIFLSTWCKENFTDFWSMDLRGIYVVNLDDLTLFKLTIEC